LKNVKSFDMKKTMIFPALAALFLAVLPACSKSGGGGGGGGTQEATLAVTLTPANGSTQAPAVGPDFPLNVNITSTLPSAGVKIDIAAEPDGSTTTFFTKSVNSSAASNDFSITGTPKSLICLVNVTVTSLSTSTNKWTGSYRYSMK
jgi:hypothetical protein